MAKAAILVLAAMVFFGKTSVALPSGLQVSFGPDSDWIRIAYLTLAPLLGTFLASALFAIALLASGQSSTITGTLAGQVVMEGFMRWRLSPWARRLVTRALAILPAVGVIAVRGNGSVTDLLTLSQVVLALQLPFAMFPLLWFTSSRRRMGGWKTGPLLTAAGWASAVLITAMDLWALPDSLRGRAGVLICNAPYVPTTEIAFMPAEARDHEALMALDGGADGLAILRRAAAEAGAWLAPGGVLLVETSERQATAMAAVMTAAGLTAQVHEDDESGATVVTGVTAGDLAIS